jgi:hypothetical protein
MEKSEVQERTVVDAIDDLTDVLIEIERLLEALVEVLEGGLAREEKL